MKRYMKKSDSQTKTAPAQQAMSQEIGANSGVPMDTMRSMLMNRAMADRSHRIDLPEAMRTKMEQSFGMNFGGVRLYESESVADAGANAIAQGGSIAFAPGKADFNTRDGRERLGHEFSHIAAQARGQVTGSGFLDNSALESRADREGAMAAAGEQVYDGPMMEAPSFSAAAPMQAQGKKFSEMDDMEKTDSIREAKRKAAKIAEAKYQRQQWEAGKDSPQKMKEDFQAKWDKRMAQASSPQMLENLKEERAKQESANEEAEKARAEKEFSTNPDLEPEFKEYQRRQRRRGGITKESYSPDEFMFIQHQAYKAALKNPKLAKLLEGEDEPTEEEPKEEELTEEEPKEEELKEEEPKEEEKPKKRELTPQEQARLERSRAIRRQFNRNINKLLNKKKK